MYNLSSSNWQRADKYFILDYYRSGTLNSKFHKIQIFYEVSGNTFFYHFMFRMHC